MDTHPETSLESLGAKLALQGAAPPPSTQPSPPVEAMPLPAAAPPISEVNDNVSIPLQDMVRPVEEINQVQVEYDRQQAEKMNTETQSRVDAVLRAHRMSDQETTQEYNERVKREFTDQVMQLRAEANKPPPLPQPVPQAISEQTAREMAAGAKQSAYWHEQQKLRPAPSARDIAAGTRNTPVYVPEYYVHEQGNASKQLNVQQTSGR